jgi:hypothetical protein
VFPRAGSKGANPIRTYYDSHGEQSSGQSVPDSRVQTECDCGEFAQYGAFFIDTASEYNSDFVLFSELQ